MMQYDELLERASRGEASPEDWRSLEDALDDPSVPSVAERQGLDPEQPEGLGSPTAAWRRVALGLRDELALRSVGANLELRMAQVDLPPEDLRAPDRIEATGVPPMAWIERSLWVAALALAFLWTSGQHGVSPSGVGAEGLELAEAGRPGDGAPVAPGKTVEGPDAAPASDRTSTGGSGGGASAPVAPNVRVLEELPRLVMDARPLIEGGPYEVFYMRRTLERAVVSELLELGEDEYGDPIAIPVSRSSPPERDDL